MIVLSVLEDGASLVAQLVKNACNVGDLGLIPVGKIPWRREPLPTPVFWPGEFHGLYSPWGCKESDTTEQLSLGRPVISELRLCKLEKRRFLQKATASKAAI